jgi:hypothetical protein
MKLNITESDTLSVELVDIARANPGDTTIELHSVQSYQTAPLHRVVRIPARRQRWRRKTHCPQSATERCPAQTIHQILTRKIQIEQKINISGNKICIDQNEVANYPNQHVVEWLFHCDRQDSYSQTLTLWNRWIANDSESTSHCRNCTSSTHWTFLTLAITEPCVRSLCAWAERLVDPATPIFERRWLVEWYRPWQTQSANSDEKNKQKCQIIQNKCSNSNQKNSNTNRTMNRAGE